MKTVTYYKYSSYLGNKYAGYSQKNSLKIIKYCSSQQFSKKGVCMNSLITQSKQMPAIGLAVAVLALGLLTACEPSKEKQAQFAEERRVECLNRICEGDVLPAHDLVKEAITKKAGRYVSIPKAYGSADGDLAFYWPSKTPKTGPPDGGIFPEKGQRFYNTAIEFFIKGESITVELSDMMASAISEGRPITQKSQSSDLEVVTIQLRPDTAELSTIYIAKATTFPSGKPAVLGCGRTLPDDRCGAYFAWNGVLSIRVRMNQRHAQDWPQIYAEITRVLSLVKPL